MNISSRWANALTFAILLLVATATAAGQMPVNDVRTSEHIWLDSDITHQGGYQWK